MCVRVCVEMSDNILLSQLKLVSSLDFVINFRVLFDGGATLMPEMMLSVAAEISSSFAALFAKSTFTGHTPAHTALRAA